MKKLYALLLTILFLFTACGREEKPIYETFDFDESVIAEEIFFDPGEGTAVNMLKAYDKEGRPVRTKTMNKGSTFVFHTEEYIYNPDGSYTTKSYQNDSSFTNTITADFSLHDKDGNTLRVYSYSYNPDDDSYLLKATSTTETNDTGLYTVRTEYDENGRVKNISTSQCDSRGRDVLTVFTDYETGMVNEITRDFENHIDSNTLYKDDVIQSKFVKYYKENSLNPGNGLGGNLSLEREEHFGPGGVLEEYTIYSYHEEDGYRTKNSTYFADGGLKEEWIFNREGNYTSYALYDEEGNLISDNPELMLLPEQK